MRGVSWTAPLFLVLFGCATLDGESSDALGGGEAAAPTSSESTCESDDDCPCDAACVSPGADLPATCAPRFPAFCDDSADCSPTEECRETTRLDGAVHCGFFACVPAEAAECDKDEDCYSQLGCPPDSICEVCCNAGQCLDPFLDDDGDGELNCTDAEP